MQRRPNESRQRVAQTQNFSADSSCADVRGSGALSHKGTAILYFFCRLDLRVAHD